MALSEDEGNTCPVQQTCDRTNEFLECPFGFGKKATQTDWEKAIAPLCCPLCRALLYESQRATPCGHCYCKTCCEKVKDCLLCASDIEEFANARDVDTQVESFIRAHSHNIDLLRDDQTFQAQGETDVLLKRSTFLLYQALKAQKCGNSASALARLQQASSELTERTEQRYVNHKSIILGKISDILCSQNELETAAQYIEQSSRLLEEAASTDEELVGEEELDILATTHSKAGDVYMLLGKDDCAISHYTRALYIKEKLTNLASNDNYSKTLQKALLFAKLAENFSSAARKRAFDAKKLIEPLAECDQSCLSERDQNVVEYVSRSISSILGE